MSVRILPVRPNADFLKQQAKDLKRAVDQRSQAALSRVRAFLPRVCARLENDASEPFRLSDAQFVLAREYGFRSWPVMKHLVEALQNPIHVFVTAVANRQKTTVDAILASAEDAIRKDIVGAAMLGDVDRVRQALANDASIATRCLPPRDVPLLWYVSYSTLHSENAAIADGIDAIAALLLEHGADPNAGFQKPEMEHPYTPLYGACGITNNARVAKRLLDAGANPDDNESLYHATEHPDHACLKLLVSHGATPAKTNALGHMLDREDVEGLTLLLEHGADPNELMGDGSNALHWAVKNNRSNACLQRVLEYGAVPDARNHDGETPYALACRLGNTDAIAWIEAQGLATPLSSGEQFVQLCMAGKREAAEAMRTSQPDIMKELTPLHQKAVADAAWQGSQPAVETLLHMGFDVNARGVHGGTALHWACWHGHVGIAQVILAYTPDLEVRCEAFGCTPFQWVMHGSDNCMRPSRNYVELARMLFEAGAKPEFVNRFDERLIPRSDSALIDYLLSIGALLE